MTDEERDYDTRPAACPICEAVHDAALAINGERPPRPGDVTICADCHAALIYTDEMTLRLPTGDEAQDIAKTLLDQGINAVVVVRRRAT